MEFLIIILIILIILGALLGGKGFGDTVRKGCGFFILLMVIVAAFFFIQPLFNRPERTYDNNRFYSTEDVFQFIVKEDCDIYTKPDINSAKAGNLLKGQILDVEIPNQFKYFYEITDPLGAKSYILKDDVEREK